MGKISQDHAQQVRHIQTLLEAAQVKADQKKLKDVHGSLLVPVDLDGGMSALVRLDSPGSKSGSVIPLQDEFAFHLMLATRVYSQIAANLYPDVDPKHFETARQSAMNRVNHYIEHAYRDAYKVAYEDGAFDLAKFNASLDKARKKLAPMAHTVLMEKIIEKTGIIFTAKDLKEAKHFAEKTPATDEDILYVNKAEGLVTLIKGSKYTAHDRVAGKEQFAHRQMITCRMDEHGNITPGLHPRIQIRTPSPVVKQGLSDKAIISDVADKLSEIAEVYELKKPFIYNRYTAINDRLGDIKGNLQTQSARHILQGAHQYNTTHDAMCFVQNISVNGFGDTLGYKSSDPLVRESTLMAEMALIHTLCDAQTFAPLLEQYQEYLGTQPRTPYFSETTQGDAAQVHIFAIKNAWKKETSTTQDPVAAVNMSLKKLIAHDLHFTHEYAKLIQTLSVFAEEASIGGCKSGNERAQAINGRVLMLDAMKPGSAIAKQLAQLANAPEDGVAAAAKALNQCINQEYNDKGLYAAASVISLVDQGASAKVEAKPKGFYISRNFAEESSKVMTYLKQSKAGAMQAHKGLTKSMRGAWSEHTLSDWAYLNSSALGVFGAVAAIVTVVPAILAVLNHRIKKQHKIEARQRQNERIQALAKCPEAQRIKVQGWIKQIGRYEIKRDPEIHLTTQEKKALYRATHQGKTPKGAREDFIRFLGLKFLDEGTLDVAKSNSGKTVTLKDLLGDEGFDLYKRAIKEEGKSKSFRRAVFETALKHVEGPPWANRLILWIGGPSSSGKTFSANNVLEYLNTEHSDVLGLAENARADKGNDVVFADGSFEREVSQMRQMVLQYALAKGYKGISDLHQHSKALEVKKYLKETVLASDRFHMVIPETFTRPGAAKEMLHYESLGNRSNFVQVFSEVKAAKGHDERFQTAVKNMGESRAWRTDSEPFNVKKIAMNNTDIGCESKIYGAGGFKWGRRLTKAFKKEYKERSTCKTTLRITNDLMYVHKNESGQWQECTFNDDLTGKKKGKDFLMLPARAYDAWLSVKDGYPNLVTWFEQHKTEEEFTGPLIEFKDNEKYRSFSSTSSGSLSSLGLFARTSSRSSEESLDNEFGRPKPRAKPGRHDGS